MLKQIFNFRLLIELIRLEKPIGIYLLVLPCFWSLALLQAAWPFYVIFGLGAILTRSAGCILNDVWDRAIDAKVDRTKSRPVASGRVSIPVALFWCGCLLLVSLFLLLQLGLKTILFGMVALVLMALYPLMKRFFIAPQLFLGITFNWGVLMVGMAVKGEIGSDIWLTYLMAICWTMVYDTIYAFQDIDDDQKQGLKSTAILFQGHPKAWLYGFSAGIALLGAMILVFHQARLGAIGLFILALVHLLHHIYGFDPRKIDSARQKFHSNLWTGSLVLLAMCAL